MSDRQEPVTTEFLLTKLEEMSEAFNKAQEDRHKVNGQSLNTSLAISAHTLQTSSDIAALKIQFEQNSRLTEETRDTVRRLETAIAGGLGSEGLAMVATRNSSRISALELKVAILIGISSFVTAVGAVMAFIQSEFHWPFRGGTP